MTESEERKLVIEDRRALLDALFQLAKWLIATLFLLNGAAALAVLSSPGLDSIIGSVIALHFVNGIMAIIVAAVGFIAGLLVSYLRIMHAMKPFSRRVFAGILVGQTICAVLVVYGSISSVGYFITGVKGWANVSVAEVGQRLQEQKQSATHPAKVRAGDGQTDSRGKLGSKIRPSGKPQ